MCSFSLTNSSTLNTDWNCCLILFPKIVLVWHHQSYVNTVHFDFSLRAQDISAYRPYPSTLGLETYSLRHTHRTCWKRLPQTVDESVNNQTHDPRFCSSYDVMAFQNVKLHQATAAVKLPRMKLKRGLTLTDTGRITRSTRCRKHSPSVIWHHMNAMLRLITSVVSYQNKCEYQYSSNPNESRHNYTHSHAQFNHVLTSGSDEKPWRCCVVC